MENRSVCDPDAELGNSVTAAQLTLDQLVEVRILIPQLKRKPLSHKGFARFLRPARNPSARSERRVSEWGGFRQPAGQAEGGDAIPLFEDLEMVFITVDSGFQSRVGQFHHPQALGLAGHFRAA